MVGNNTALGNVINQWLLRNADAFGLQYDLWQQAEWSPNGTVKPMADRGSPTQNHRDHVHPRVRPGAPESGNYMPVGATDWNLNGTTPVRVESFGSEASQTMQQSSGAQLDSDFGISNGFPGIIENIVKAIANISFAPVFGALSGVTSAYGSAGPGSGILGAFAPRQNAVGQSMPNALGQFPSGSSRGGFASIPGAPTTPLPGGWGGNTTSPGTSPYGGTNGAQSVSGLGSLGAGPGGSAYNIGNPLALPDATRSYNTPSRSVPLGQGLP